MGIFNEQFLSLKHNSFSALTEFKVHRPTPLHTPVVPLTSQVTVRVCEVKDLNEFLMIPFQVHWVLLNMSTCCLLDPALTRRAKTTYWGSRPGKTIRCHFVPSSQNIWRFETRSFFPLEFSNDSMFMECPVHIPVQLICCSWLRPSVHQGVWCLPSVYHTLMISQLQNNMPLKPDQNAACLSNIEQLVFFFLRFVSNFYSF